jgi:hypothetical protein
MQGRSCKNTTAPAEMRGRDQTKLDIEQCGGLDIYLHNEPAAWRYIPFTRCGQESD